MRRQLHVRYLGLHAALHPTAPQRGWAGCSHSPAAPASLLTQEGEQTWLLAGRLGAPGGSRRPRAEMAAGGAAAAAGGDAEAGGRGAPAPHEAHDVPAEELADEDSRFLEDCQGLQVHYNMALPQVSRERSAGESLAWLLYLWQRPPWFYVVGTVV